MSEPYYLCGCEKQIDPATNEPRAFCEQHSRPVKHLVLKAETIKLGTKFPAPGS
jgi:hypothetical protein